MTELREVARNWWRAWRRILAAKGAGSRGRKAPGQRWAFLQRQRAGRPGEPSLCELWLSSPLTVQEEGKKKGTAVG